jgi:hypothetical protein
MEERKPKTDLFLQNTQNWRIDFAEYYFQEILISKITHF